MFQECGLNTKSDPIGKELWLKIKKDVMLSNILNSAKVVFSTVKSTSLFNKLHNSNKVPNNIPFKFAIFYEVISTKQN